MWHWCQEYCQVRGGFCNHISFGHGAMSTWGPLPALLSCNTILMPRQCNPFENQVLDLQMSSSNLIRITKCQNGNGHQQPCSITRHHRGSSCNIVTQRIAGVNVTVFRTAPINICAGVIINIHYDAPMRDMKCWTLECFISLKSVITETGTVAI